MNRVNGSLDRKRRPQHHHITVFPRLGAFCFFMNKLGKKRKKTETENGNFWKVCVQTQNYILGNLQQAGG